MWKLEWSRELWMGNILSEGDWIYGEAEEEKQGRYKIALVDLLLTTRIGRRSADDFDRVEVSGGAGLAFVDVGCEPKNIDWLKHLSNYVKIASRSVRSWRDFNIITHPKFHVTQVTVKYFASLKNDDLTIRSKMIISRLISRFIYRFWFTPSLVC